MATTEAETSQDQRGSQGGLVYDGFISYSHAADDLFCPDHPVTRGQMAAFVVRALDLAAVVGAELVVDGDKTRPRGVMTADDAH
jgi:hypothetical protein